MIKVYNLNMQPQAFLENAFSIGYEKNFNEVWYAHFSLPLDDPKNEYCQPFYYVEVFEDNAMTERVELFRIMPENIVKDESNRQINYECEHVLATLMDDVLFRYHHSGTNQTTRTVLEYLLSQQTVTRWQLGDVDFERYFEYKWENENLLGSLFSVPKPIGQHMWEWDTTTFPWTLHLREATTEVTSEIRYRKNMQSIEKEEDPTELVTRLYALGYGEGVNQLGIENVNPSGQPYIDADTQDRYGVISSVFVDKRYEDEESLFESAKQELEHLKIPRLTYTATAVDLARITDEPVEKFKCGYITRIYDDELDIEVYARIVKESKADVKGDPGNIDIEIANKAKDIAGSISELNDRQRVNDVYAQGATNMNTESFYDNADADYPAVMRVYIPEETVRINKMELSFFLEAFRGYSRATEGGGATTVTSEDGGSTVVTSSSGGGQTTSSGGGQTTSSGGGVNTTSGTSTRLISKWEEQKTTSDVAGHTHTYYDEHIDLGDLENHTHSINLDSHTHSVSDHTHSVSDHTHDVEIDPHSHEIQLPNHTHEIEHGIYEGPTATEVSLEIDGQDVSVGTSETNLDLIPYLSKDGSGRVQRGTWHEIRVKPNDLARVVANIFTQFFVQSRGGGDY